MDPTWTLVGFLLAIGLVFYSVRKYTKQRVSEIKKEQQKKLASMVDDIIKSIEDYNKNEDKIKDLTLLSNRLLTGDFEKIRKDLKDKELSYESILGNDKFQSLKKEARKLYRDEDLYSSYLSIIILREMVKREDQV